jgi:DNA-directed RNA polymerase subunit beta
VGDKIAGRHGNKGIISRILPVEDMPYLPDGTPVDVVLNPLGVPSRMNVGQVYECLLGWAAEHLGVRFKLMPFDEMHGLEASRLTVEAKLREAREKTGKDWIFNPEGKYCGKVQVFDGRTGQRFGEMEVWALEAFGAAYILQELLTVKSDDMVGRNEALNAIVKGKPIPRPGTPESFKVLVRELQSLCLDVSVYKVEVDSKGQPHHVEVDLMADVSTRHVPSRPTYQSITAEDLSPAAREGFVASRSRDEEEDEDDF